MRIYTNKNHIINKLLKALTAAGYHVVYNLDQRFRDHLQISHLILSKFKLIN